MYKIGLKDDVMVMVAGFDPTTLGYWHVSLSLIADNPLPHHGSYSEQLVPIPGISWRTYNYWISEVKTEWGETIFVFTAEYFDYRPVYVIDQEGQEVEIFSVRARWIYDPI